MKSFEIEQLKELMEIQEVTQETLPEITEQLKNMLHIPNLLLEEYSKMGDNAQKKDKTVNYDFKTIFPEFEFSTKYQFMKVASESDRQRTLIELKDRNPNVRRNLGTVIEYLAFERENTHPPKKIGILPGEAIYIADSWLTGTIEYPTERIYMRTDKIPAIRAQLQHVN